MGMTYDLYWNEDCMLVKDYREAHRLRGEMDNYKAWLQGMYIYDALCDVSPLLHAFSKGPVRAKPYPSKPYEFKQPEKPKVTEVEKKKKIQPGLDRMRAFMTEFNRGLAKRQANETETGEGVMKSNGSDLRESKAGNTDIG